MTVQILQGDCREVLRGLADESVHCVVTSPPYWGLRDYGNGDAGIGLESSVSEHIEALVVVFREVRRVLRSDGTLWLNYGDAYNSGSQFNHGKSGGKAAYNEVTANRKWPGHRPLDAGLKPKDLIGLPWRLAFALQADGWWLRSDIVWAKPNPMPESVTDRPTRAHEYVFLLTKSPRYAYDADAIRVPGSVNSHGGRPNQGGPKQDAMGKNHGGRLGVPARVDKQRGHGRRHNGFNERWDKMSVADQRAGGANARTVWTIATEAFPEAHFATFPTELARRCILAGCPEGGTVLDPFGGAGTVGLVADRLKRDAILIEMNAGYCDMARRRIAGDAPLFAEVTR